MEAIPSLRLTKHGLVGTVSLPVWQGFQSRQGDYGARDAADATGTVGLAIGGDSGDEAPAVRPEHLRAYDYLTTHAAEVQAALLAALLLEYKELQVLYGYDPAEAATLMPDVHDAAQFRQLIGLSGVHILNVARDGVAYVGYEFGCTWDEEHGLGIMTYQDRVVEVGDAASAFMNWVAEQDLE